MKKQKENLLRKIGVTALSATILAGGLLPSISLASEVNSASAQNHDFVIPSNVGEEAISLKTITDNNEERVVEAVQNGETTTSTFDKENNMLTIQVGDNEPIVINMDQAEAEYLNSVNTNTSISDDGNTPLLRATIQENTFSNYEYTIKTGTTEKWDIRRPKGKSLTQWETKSRTYNSSSKANLNSFKSQVDKINTLEFQVFGSVLTTAGLSWLSFMLSVPTAGAATLSTGLAALGAYGTTLNRCLSLHTAMKNAALYYGRA